LTLDEVEAVLGAPAASAIDLRVEAPAEEVGFRWLRVWVDAGARLEVQFAEDGRVKAATCWGRPQFGPLSRLRAWLGW